MTFEINLPKALARAAAIAVVAIGASACSSVPTWVNPTNWVGGSDDTTTANGQTPDLASIPDKPAVPSTVDERTQVANALKADRADAQYSADALRGGTEPSAAPPSDTPAADTTTASTVPAPATPAVGSSAPAAATQTATVDGGAAPAHAQTAEAAAPAQQPAAPAPAEPTQPATQMASTQSPPPDANAAMPSDEQLGFEASKAPALDPSVAHFVAPAVLNQIQQTSAQAAAVPALTPPPAPKADAPQKSSELDPAQTARGHRSYTNAAQDRTPSYGGMSSPASYGSNSGPHAVVFFPRDAAILGAKAKTQVAATAQAYLSSQSTGFVRIVGHSSSRTADMPLAQHLAVVFQHSQDFATAVAQELIRDGVPADKVLVEAVGDSQPVYFESMPQGEAGNRRAEIFL
ncbi:MAG: OmpA family protein [Rhizomicrobium sp.]|jgi:outer membrane protein OmpA-like peptidoglycan-associated protein